MKSFRFTATDKKGDKISGKLDVDKLSDATDEIQGRGLDLHALEEIQDEEKEAMKPFIFEGVDKEGEKVQGVIQGEDKSSVKKTLKEDFGYQLNSLNAKQESNIHRPSGAPQSSGESIIFNQSPKISQKKEQVPLSQLNELQTELEELLSEKGASLSKHSQDEIYHLLEKVDWVRRSQNKLQWKRLHYQIRVQLKQFKKEIASFEEQKWEELERKRETQLEETYDDFDSAPVRPQRKPGFIKTKLGQLSRRLQMMNRPNLHSEQEMIIKQQYESVWMELQRFMGALFVFYIACFFAAYYLKQEGMTDHFLVRIYDTTLFKQLVLTLFSLYGLLTLRHHYLPKRILSDLILVLVFAAIVVVLYGA